MKAPHLKSITYPAISLIVVFIAIGLFVRAAGFLSAQINKPFAAATEAQNSGALKINTAGYEQISRKIGNGPKNSDQSIDGSYLANRNTEKKADLKIAVVNASTKIGVARALANSLEIRGFTVVYTGDLETNLETTYIEAKNSAVETYPQSLTEIREIVSEDYVVERQKALDDTSQYDITVVIGEK